MKRRTNRTGDPACVCCFEVSCFGCSVGREPDYEEDNEDDRECELQE